MASMNDCSEEKPFLNPAKEDYTESGNHYRRSTSKWARHAPWAAHCFFFALYSISYLLFFKTDTTSATTSLHPINGLNIEFVPWAYDDFEQSPWAGVPSHSIDSAWHRLLEHTTIRVSAEELARSNQSSVELPQGGGYMAWLGVFHELHCIKMVRQWVYRDFYHPNLTMNEFEEWSIHADHCIDVLRSAALCHADTTLTTFGWANKSKPMLNTRPINHKCVGWDALMNSVNDRIVSRDEMAALVNPNL